VLLRGQWFDIENIDFKGIGRFVISLKFTVARCITLSCCGLPGCWPDSDPPKQTNVAVNKLILVGSAFHCVMNTTTNFDDGGNKNTHDNIF
jgi:hypothetical protein